jgi:Domain of unknown function (DUF4129)
MRGDGLCAGVLRPRRGRPGWAVPLLLFLAVLIVSALAFNLANLNTGGEAIPVVPGAGGTPASQVGNLASDPTAEAAVLIMTTLLFAGAAALLLRRRAKGPRATKPFSWWEALTSVLGLGLFIVLLVIWPRVVRAFNGVPGTSDATGGGAVTDTAWPVASGLPLGLFLAGTVLVSFLVLAYLLRRGAGPFVEDTEEPLGIPAARHAAAEAVQEAIEDLSVGGDVRAAILACYQRFCALLGSRGMSEQKALTPRELEGFAVLRLHVSRDASETLTSLFEEARYSEHRLGETDRHRAIDSLAGIRAALEA